MRLRRTIATVVACGLVALLILSGCSKTAQEVVTTGATTAAPATTTTSRVGTTAAVTTTAVPAVTGPNGTLRMGMSDFSDSALDPINTGPNVFAPMLYEFPIQTKLGTNQLMPGQIESWAVAPDGNSWTFTLRKGLKFQNGDALTSADLKFSLDRFSTPESRSQYITQMVARTEIVDAYTVRCVTNGPQPYMAVQMSTLGTAAFIHPKGYFEKVGAAEFERHPVGAGPWKFVSVVPGDSITFEGYDMGWRPAPAFKTLQGIAVPEEGTRIAMMKTGGIDLADMSLESAMSLQKIGFRTTNMAPSAPMVDFIGAYNPLAAKMPAGDLRVRQALSLAVNRDEIMKNFFYGMASPAVAPFAPSNTPADVDVAYWKDYAAKNYRYDPAAAQQLLKDAGYPNGFSITLLTQPENEIPDMPKLAEVVAGYWLKIGVKANIRMIEDTYWKQVRNPEAKGVTTEVGSAATYTMSVSGNVARQMDSGFRSKGSCGLLGSNAQIDDLVNRAYTELDPAKRQAIMAQIIKAGFDSYTALVWCEAPVLVVMGSQVDLTLSTMDTALTPFVQYATHTAK